MKIEIDEFVLRHVFNYIEPKGDESPVWWAPVVGGGEGWILLWEDGQYHHTYHDPEWIYEDTTEWEED
jgi:hypothetical protein